MKKEVKSYSSVKVETKLLGKIRKHIAKSKHTISGFLQLAVDEKLAPTPTYYMVADNSNGFRQFLQESKIDFKPNGSFTAIPVSVDIFVLGKKFQQYKDSFNGAEPK